MTHEPGLYFYQGVQLAHINPSADPLANQWLRWFTRRADAVAFLVSLGVSRDDAEHLPPEKEQPVPLAPVTRPEPPASSEQDRSRIEAARQPFIENPVYDDVVPLPGQVIQP